MSKQKSPTKFEDIPVIGTLPPRQVAAKLRRMGDPATADDILAHTKGQRGKAKLLDWGPHPAWKHVSHQYGYLPLLSQATGDPQPIQFAGTVGADASLKDRRINIHLDRLRVYQYPGGGRHKILFTFKAQNQLPNAPEPVSFSQMYEIQEGETAGVAGQPVFIGLNVGKLGVGFEVSTVNVRNASDQTILDVLDSPPFKSGLNLLTTAQPVLKPFTDITLGVAKMFATRNDNVKVQQVSLGLDFTPAALGIRLAQGNYILVQVPSENSINWTEWEFNPPTGTILSKNTKTMLPYNYIVFRVTLYEDGG